MTDEIHYDDPNQLEFFAHEVEDIALPSEPLVDRQSSIRAPDCTGGIPFALAVDEKRCEWPLWSGADKIGNCCGEPRYWRQGLGGSVLTHYCEFHYRKAYSPRSAASGE